FAERWRVLRPSPEREAEAEAEVAVSPCARAAGVYVLADGPRGRRVHEGARDLLGTMEGPDVVAWLVDADGAPLLRAATRPSAAAVTAASGQATRSGRSSRAGSTPSTPTSARAGRWETSRRWWTGTSRSKPRRLTMPPPSRAPAEASPGGVERGAVARLATLA